MGRQYPIMLIVDDSDSFREFARHHIKTDIKFITILLAKNGVECLQMYKQHKPDVILLDWKMPGLDGIQVLKAIMRDDARTKVIMTTAYTEDQELLNQMMVLGAFSFVPKPMQRVNLLKVVADALRERKNIGMYGQIPKPTISK
ncbi:response regulator transcription factor [Candidatus Nitrosarchaeum limnium]|jgi:CheY-like chemotaxis protein|uniref:Response regulator receiver domain protein n=1 Tax=Candidatus Nitrosarchaeum limnium BG20 TaxID=859192 RepID=S2E5I7_9ARCH|nr:response regulator [Candidatus Nitrosarchaeum limnium]EPA05988.1 response regulator receiver domain protein [Candidatus Nitrosarchaeum limnium BG20]